MKIGMIIYYTFIRHLRDLRVIITFVVMPLVMIAILGAALNHQFSPKSVEAVKVGFISEEDDVITDALDQFLHSDQTVKMIDLKPMNSYDDGIAAVKKGEIVSFIYLPKAQGSQADMQRSIEIYSNNKGSIVFPVMESFIRVFNLNDVMIKLKGTPADLTMNDRLIEETKIVTEGKIPRGIDYYSVATLMQFILFGAMYGVFAITKDLGNHTYNRLIAAPVRSVQVTLGKFVGSTLSLYVICMLIFLGTKFIYKGNWDGSLWLILTVFLLLSMISISLGMITAFITKNTMVSSLILFVVMFMLTFVAGGFSPMDGSVFDFLSQFSPNTYGQKLLFSNIYDGILDQDSLIKLLIFTCVAIVPVFLLGRRKLI